MRTPIIVGALLAAAALYSYRETERCAQLQFAQYEKRQAILAYELSKCGEEPNCAPEVIRYAEYLIKFDAQVRIHEGCSP